MTGKLSFAYLLESGAALVPGWRLAPDCEDSFCLGNGADQVGAGASG